MSAINKSRVCFSSISLWSEKQCFRNPHRVSRWERLLLESMPCHYLRCNQTIAITPRHYEALCTSHRPTSAYTECSLHQRASLIYFYYLFLILCVWSNIISMKILGKLIAVINNFLHKIFVCINYSRIYQSKVPL